MFFLRRDGMKKGIIAVIAAFIMSLSSVSSAEEANTTVRQANGAISGGIIGGAAIGGPAAVAGTAVVGILASDDVKVMDAPDDEETLGILSGGVVGGAAVGGPVAVAVGAVVGFFIGE